MDIARRERAVDIARRERAALVDIARRERAVDIARRERAALVDIARRERAVDIARRERGPFPHRHHNRPPDRAARRLARNALDGATAELANLRAVSENPAPAQQHRALIADNHPLHAAAQVFRNGRHPFIIPPHGPTVLVGRERVPVRVRDVLARREFDANQPHRVVAKSVGGNQILVAVSVFRCGVDFLFGHDGAEKLAHDSSFGALLRLDRKEVSR